MRALVAATPFLFVHHSVPQFPSEDEKLRATSLLKRRGGNGPNTTEVLQQCLRAANAPLKVALCTVLPNRRSLAVKTIQESLGSEVDLSKCVYRDSSTEPASSYIIRSNASGSRTIVNHNDLPEMTTEEFMGIADSIGQKAVWYHFEV